MAENLIDSLRSLVTPQVLSQAASTYGETEGAVSKGLSTAIPSLLAAMLSKLGDQGAMSQVFALLSDPSNNGTTLSNLSGLLNPAKGNPGSVSLATKFLSSTLGNRQGGFEGFLAESTGMKRTSVTSLLEFAAPMMMAFLANKIRKEGLSLSTLLKIQRSNILAAVPSGISNVLGLNEPPPVPVSVPRVEEPASTQWLLPLVLTIAALGLFWWFFANRPAKVANSMVQQSLAQVQNPTGIKAPFPDLGAYMKHSLPTNVELNIPEHGMEIVLLTFVEDPSRQVDANAWINFDRLLFESGSAVLKPSSEEQLVNVAEILKAYPKVQVKIGGYTDNVGDPAFNMRLSQDRATNVMNELVRFGVTSSRLQAEGYGEQHPVGDNSTEAGRAMNRRLALRIDQK